MGAVGNERAVYFQPVDWERPQPGEIGIADFEIIYCDLHAARAQPVELFDQEGIALDQRRLGDLKIEKIPWRARRFHRLLQHAEEVRALKLARADVQADARVDVLPVPCGERPGNGAHRPFADVDDDRKSTRLTPS